MIRHEIDVIRHQLQRNRVDVLAGEAAFVDPHTLRLNDVDGQGHHDLRAGTILVATGTHATRDGHIPFDGQRILTSDDILGLAELPRTLVVVGAGVIGLRVREHLRGARACASR